MRVIDTVTYYIPSYPQFDRVSDAASTAEEAIDIAESHLYDTHGEDALITDVTYRRRDTGRRDWVITFDIEYTGGLW